jgi:hypothetical protein
MSHHYSISFYKSKANKKGEMPTFCRVAMERENSLRREQHPGELSGTSGINVVKTFPKNQN